MMMPNSMRAAEKVVQCFRTLRYLARPSAYPGSFEKNGTFTTRPKWVPRYALITVGTVARAPSGSLGVGDKS